MVRILPAKVSRNITDFLAPQELILIPRTVKFLIGNEHGILINIGTNQFEVNYTIIDFQLKCNINSIKHDV